MPAESPNNGIFVCEQTLGIEIKNHLTSDQLMYQQDQRLVMISGRCSGGSRGGGGVQWFALTPSPPPNFKYPMKMK